MALLCPPQSGDDWLGITEDPLAVGAAADWSVLPRCGAVVAFSGTARDHDDTHDGVERLEYEAYPEQVLPRLEAIAREARSRWPTMGRLVMLHRVGLVELGESSVVVVASAPHRDDAFAAARFGIDTIKAALPVWKREHFDGGQAWSPNARPVVGVDEVD